MIPTEVLKHEHEIILMVLDAAEREAGRVQDSGKVNADALDKMVDFFRNFADHCHHAKEEKQLFAKMRERGMPGDRGPIAVMLLEHDEGRRRVRAVAEALPQAQKGDSLAIRSLQENLSAYVQLLRAHIDKEDNVLYPMADQLFTPEDQRALAEAFEKIEAEEVGEGVHEKYHQLAYELAEG
ncbi:MAG: hemerythrin domain-containing protein [Chloroflexi bacterium]|nr:hemerythrin domain-containing protein [Chloroflexota bacterium]